MRRAFALALLLSACTTSPDPPVSFVAGLRVLAGRAEPPQVDPGGASQVSLLVVDTGGLPVEVAWNRCTLMPRAGEAVNPGCVMGGGPPNLVPIGMGESISTTMPQVTAADLGTPDATGGVYLPLVAQVSDGADAVTVVYRLRLGDGKPPNMNPGLQSIEVVDAAGVATPIDPVTPLVVHAGQQLSLHATATPGSAELYTVPSGLTITETLTTAWFCTAGSLNVNKTGPTQAQITLSLQKNLPSPGKNIDLFAVVHDERGGVGYTHRVLELQ
jgi:hypothetical protein